MAYHRHDTDILSRHYHVGPANLTDEVLTMPQYHTLEIVERSMSAISILSFLVIIGTFLGFKSFNRKLFNRLVFYASFGNAASNLATMIARDGIKAGDDSGLCQLQGFLIQWFMPADALWAFCMALNVFVAFRTTQVSINFHRLGRLYIAACYGFPFAIAAIYLILDLTMHHGFYGDANLWCWIQKDHEPLRVATFYGPVWVLILVIAGFYIYTYRTFDTAELVSHRSEFEGDCPEYLVSIDSDPARPNWLAQGNTHHSSKMTEIVQYSEKSEPSKEDSLFRDSSKSSTADSPTEQQAPNPDVVLRIPSPLPKYLSSSYISTVSKQQNGLGSNTEVTTYCYAELPTKINTSFRKCKTLIDTTSCTNRGAKQYTLVAFIVFIALLVVWVPATANRLWGIVSPKSVPFVVSLTAAIVLPLQGFLNCVIYLFFSRAELKMELRKQIYRFESIDRSREGSVDYGTPSNGFCGDLEKGIARRKQGSMYPGLECYDNDADDEGEEAAADGEGHPDMRGKDVHCL